MSTAERIVYKPSQTTHWKNLFPNKMLLLGSQNLNEGEELIAEIKDIHLETIRDKQGNDEEVVVETFVNEPPMVLNITNTRTIASLYGDKYDKWYGRSIQIYAVPVKAFGEVTTALRIREAIPDTSEDIKQYEDILDGCETIDELQKAFTEVPKHLKIKLREFKDTMKHRLL